MRGSGLAPGDIDRVFLTGGSSFVPAVRQMFVERFGDERVTGGEELTSVATGLALRAREQWPRQAVSSSSRMEDSASGR